jgi:geranylgeranyl pyrophosphate synthase
MNECLDWITAQSLIEAQLTADLSRLSCYDTVLPEAMRYCSLGGGKRLRGYAVLLSMQAVGHDIQSALIYASAVELIHAYSLIHDDLPALDNAAVRRGKRSAHLYFNEAIALLTGDALLTYAFELISQPLASISPHSQLSFIQALSKACGPCGMISGQFLDLYPQPSKRITMQTLKTGYLFGLACSSGPLLTQDIGKTQAWRDYGEKIGLLFQLKDDIEDGDHEPEDVSSMHHVVHALKDGPFPTLLHAIWQEGSKDP